jgi:signal transduction histidine kinase
VSTRERGRGIPSGAEILFALLASVADFALAAIIAAVALPDVPVIVLGILYIFAILGIARFAGLAYAVPIGVASVVALDWYYIPPTHPSIVPTPEDVVALTFYLVIGVLLGQVAARARRRADASELARSTLVAEQSALRRVATLVAREPSPQEVFTVVADELRRLLGADVTGILRYETDGTATVVAGRSDLGTHIPVGTRLAADGANAAAREFRAGRPARIDSLANAAGSLAEFLREWGVRSCAGSSIVVAGRLWGVLFCASVRSGPLPAGTESRIAEFTDLVATAISNAETRAELQASRARVVAAGDETRRRLQRDLHDGAQQRLVALALELRVAGTMAPPELGDLHALLARVGDELVGVLDDLREISHGIHPAILTQSGLRPALKTLARRSGVPVELDIRGNGRLPEQVEVAVYYIVSEGLTNAAKHAEASVVLVGVESEDGFARLSIRDDGVGGADPRQGSGLVGLRDRVEALGGRIEITSPSGSGTALVVTLPVGDVALATRADGQAVVGTP